MSGSSVVLAYVAAALILTHRRPILVMTTSNDVLQLFNQVWYMGNKMYVSVYHICSVTSGQYRSPNFVAGMGKTYEKSLMNLMFCIL